MAKLKVGDSVRVASSGMRLPLGTEGVLMMNSSESSFQYRFLANNPVLGWMAVCEDEVEPIEPAAPQPRTIPARNLSGKHIGRVVTAESISGSVGVTATLDAVTQESEKTVLSFRNGGVFNTNPIFLMTVSPESEVIVNA